MPDTTVTIWKRLFQRKKLAKELAAKAEAATAEDKAREAAEKAAVAEASGHAEAVIEEQMAAEAGHPVPFMADQRRVALTQRLQRRVKGEPHPEALRLVGDAATDWQDATRAATEVK